MIVYTKDGVRVWRHGKWLKPSECLEIARLNAQLKLEKKA